MLAIIAHHFVVNSTVLDLFGAEHTAKQTFLFVLGMWGKTAINIFVLISGYYLCASSLTLKRYLKLLAQVLFYSYLINLIFLLTGYVPFSFSLITRPITSLFSCVNNGFTASFLVFYAGVPLYNLLLKNISQKQLCFMLALLLGVFTICSTFFKANTMNEPFWYMTLYFVAALIRRFDKDKNGSDITKVEMWMKKMSNDRMYSWALFVGSVIIAAASVIVISNYRSNLNTSKVYWFVSDSNKIMAFLVGVFAFLAFKNLPGFHSRVVNFFSAGTFSVLLIHAHSDTMRKFLWQEVVKVPDLFHGDFIRLLFVAILAPITIFVLCSSVDWFRRRFLEKPLFRRGIS